jgi:hypothetical protein
MIQFELNELKYIFEPSGAPTSYGAKTWRLENVSVSETECALAAWRPPYSSRVFMQTVKVVLVRGVGMGISRMNGPDLADGLAARSSVSRVSNLVQTRIALPEHF